MFFILPVLSWSRTPPIRLKLGFQEIVSTDIDEGVASRENKTGGKIRDQRLWYRVGFGPMGGRGVSLEYVHRVDRFALGILTDETTLRKSEKGKREDNSYIYETSFFRACSI